MRYEKPTLTVEEQINLLKSRNLVIEDTEETRFILSNISYYRLSSYLYPFRIPRDENQSFYKGTNFNDAMKVYSFDRKLRIMLFGVIERFEIAFRTQFIHQMATKYNKYWYLNPRLFDDCTKFVNITDSFKKEFRQSKEVFVKHYKKKYSEPEFPPSWMGLEIFTFGQISNHFRNLKSFKDKKDIAKYFNINSKVFESWLHSIVYLRNICAHHSRLWNRTLGIKPKLPKSNKGMRDSFSFIRNDKVFVLISILKYFLDIIHPKNSFKEKLIELLEEYPNINIGKMGFPKGWSKNRIWENKTK